MTIYIYIYIWCLLHLKAELESVVGPGSDDRASGVLLERVFLVHASHFALFAFSAA